ncbi:MAG: SMC-Scp complex subunit ScpB [Chlorobiaceae bacterium]|nr:SMC-Scp complex subunit ScpB [Chlorobiaceae bacterium]NTW74385.1 SMC-Scp complex subunit ScpB [Chlorobiaceae bacterium]
MQDQDRHILQSIEALIFASEEAITFQTICQVTGFDLKYRELEEIVEALNREYEATGRTFRIHSIAGGFRFLSEPEHGDLIRKLLAPVIQRRLSRSMLEVLSVVAWHQPVTRGDIQQIRGVSPDYAVDRLMERGLIEVRGRAEAPGRPLQYGTSREFLDLFHLSSLRDLPKLREIREILQEHEEQQYLSSGNDAQAVGPDEISE